MKYKLIKEYPGSPKLGNIIDNLENDWIENYSEFWEEVVEKDYEILSMKCNKSKCVHSNNTESSINFMLQNDYSIHSIKRLSDGEIFTIGDIIDTKVDDKYKQEILEINLRINYNLLKDKLIFKTKAGYVVINIAVKNKQPIFKTEDGVDIYEGDYSYGVHNSKFDIVKIKHINTVYVGDNFIEFSTKEKAEEYILLNKPCLSYNEVLKAVSIKNKNTFETLKILVKSKIQQSV